MILKNVKEEKIYLKKLNILIQKLYELKSLILSGHAFNQI